jgi:uncharacterized protein (DUF3820 family)
MPRRTPYDRPGFTSVPRTQMGDDRPRYFVRLPKMPVDGTQVIVPFGKYKGEDLESVPCTYLQWMAENCRGFMEARHMLFLKQLDEYLRLPCVQQEIERRTSRA